MSGDNTPLSYEEYVEGIGGCDECSCACYG